MRGGPVHEGPIKQEREHSHLYGGRSVLGFEPPPAKPARRA